MYKFNKEQYESLTEHFNNAFGQKVEIGFLDGDIWHIDSLSVEAFNDADYTGQNSFSQQVEMFFGETVEQITTGNSEEMVEKYAIIYGIDHAAIYNDLLNSRSLECGISNEGERPFRPIRLLGVDASTGEKMDSHVTNRWYFKINCPVSQYDYLMKSLSFWESIVDTDPNEDYQVSYYKIYKYLPEDQKELYKDWTKAPHGLNYNISITPKSVKSVETVTRGYLTNVVWSCDGDEILKVDIDYTSEETGKSMPTAEFSNHRTTNRKWMKNTGYQSDDLDIKCTKKDYVTYDQKNKERAKRMTTIQNKAVEQYVTLITIMITNGDVLQAETLGKAFFNDVAFELGQYLSIASDVIIKKLQELIDNEEHFMHVLVPEHPYITGLVPNAIGETIGGWLQKKLSGTVD